MKIVQKETREVGKIYQLKMRRSSNMLEAIRAIRTAQSLMLKEAKNIADYASEFGTAVIAN